MLVKYCTWSIRIKLNFLWRPSSFSEAMIELCSPSFRSTSKVIVISICGRVGGGLRFSEAATLCRDFRWHRCREDRDPRAKGYPAPGYLPTKSAGFRPCLHKKRAARADLFDELTGRHHPHTFNCGMVCMRKQSIFESVHTSKENDRKYKFQNLVDQPLYY